LASLDLAAEMMMMRESFYPAFLFHDCLYIHFYFVFLSHVLASIYLGNIKYKIQRIDKVLLSMEAQAQLNNNFRAVKNNNKNGCSFVASSSYI